MTFPSKRSGININNGPSSPFEQHALVDMFRGGALFGPFSTSYATGTMWNADCVDETTGIPNTAATRTRAFGGFGCYMPSSSEFTGKFVLTWDGDGEFQFTSGTWTVDAGLSSGYSEVSNGRWGGTDPYIVVTYTGAGGAISSRFNSHDRSNVDNYITAVHFYRLEDEARFQAGKVYRTGYLQQYATLNPGYVRMMNAGSINAAWGCRFEHRNKPTRQAFGGIDILACDTYGEITGTNTYAIANSAASPVAMKHGEVVCGRITNSIVRATSRTVTAITKANPGVVTATAHGFNTGDIIVHQVAGMTQLDRKPVTVTVSDANTYDIGIDTSAYSVFTSGTAKQFITLNRGGLGAYPVVFADGTTYASEFGNSYIAAGDYKNFSFDKYLVASTEVTGAWIFSNLATTPWPDGISAEIMTQFFIELDELQEAQGLGPTDMYICVPHRGLLSVDPDYDAASHYGVNLVDVILNGANGYPGLKTRPRISLLNAFTNENWNGAGAFPQTAYLARLGFLRWGGSATDYGNYSTLRTVILFNDIKTAFPSEPQLKYIMEGQGTFGVSGHNNTRINGAANFDSDVWNTWGTAPHTHYDAFAWAGYFLAGSTYDTANLATLAASYAAATTDAAREAVCATYVNDGVVNSGFAEAIARYRDTLLPAYADEMASHGKYAMQYEGGWDKTVTGGTAEVNAFLVACKRSRAWARAYQNYVLSFRELSGHPNVATHAYYPADYIMVDQRWGHAYPDTYSGGVEGGNLDRTWIQIGKNNRGIRTYELTTS